MQQLSEQRSDQRSLGELFAELAQETGTLVRKEVELARVEMTDKAKVAGRNAGFVALGGAVAMMGALALLAALILGLGTFMPLWLSALIVGAAVTATGALLVTKGFRAFSALEVAPRETLQTLKEDKQWLQKEASR
ncbi:MAG: hypothetical protein JWP97_687 [Labilithrix sp.]|nr:hypothetical protein [Labilithrix sp.]